MPAADVTVIIVNHDGGHHVVRCLKCLAVQTSLPARILLLDNASQDDSAAACARTIAGDERLRHRAQVQ
jgi:GT2 family glycosyltransferase